MKHLTDEDCTLLYYGEGPAGADEHLAGCELCRSKFRETKAALDSIELPAVPERGEDYGAQVWQRLRPRLTPERTPSIWEWLFAPRRWAVVGAMAALVVAAFLAGRFSGPRREPSQAVAPQVRERVLLVAVGDHLERSQMVLLELVNTRPGVDVDISQEQQRAQDLITSNRLYRQTAARAGETGVASVLDELERVLLEIAHSPAQLSSTQFEDLRRRVEEQGILFKVRIIDSQVREKAIRRNS